MTDDRATAVFGPPIVRIAGDMGLLVEFGEVYHPRINTAVMAFDTEVTDLALNGVIETVPSFRSLLIRFDPLTLAFKRLKAEVEALLARQDWYLARPPGNRRSWVLPVCYGGAKGVDLGEVADLTGLREDQVAAAHSEHPLTVAMLGFSPGLAYLGQLPEIWDFPRKTEITPKVPCGAILVAVRQTVLPGTDIPTGWRQIGQTPFRSFNPDHSVPFLLSPGDEVRFEPVTETAFAAYDMDQVLREGRA